jgi:Mce-associated membrane protein
MADDAAAPEGEVGEVSSEGEDTVAEAEDAEAADDADNESAKDDDEPAQAKPRMSHVRLALILGLVTVVALAGVCGWLGFRAYESRKAAHERSLFLQVGRQGALNLTTIDFEHVDDDVKRILASSTGAFYDEFEARSQPFKEVVKQAKSKSVGTIAEAGVQSISDDSADVLVAVTVKTSNAGAAEQEPRAWRMLISVQKDGDEAKVSNVRFVS